MSDNWQSLPVEIRWMVRDPIRSIMRLEVTINIISSSYEQIPLFT